MLLTGFRRVLCSIAFVKPELIHEIRQWRLRSASTIEHCKILLLFISAFAAILVSIIVADRAEIVKQMF